MRISIDISRIHVLARLLTRRRDAMARQERGAPLGCGWNRGRAGALPYRVSVAALLFAFAANCGAQTNTVSAATQWSIVSRAADSEILATTTSRSLPTGKTVPTVHHVTRIASGLNYWDGTAWQRSDPTFQLSADGQYVYANKVQMKIQLAANLATSNSLTITSPDGIVLSTTPIAVGLYDAVSGSSTIIGSITNCSGTLISSNRVLYENCFNGLSGSIMYTLERGSFSQDIIWQQDIDPSDYNFPTNSTRIQIFSAFNSPAPQETARPLYVETNEAVRAQMASPDFIDHTLNFGQLKFGPGRAVSTTATNTFAGAPIAKDFETINGQGYVVESIEFKDIRADLQALPRGTASRTRRLKHQHDRLSRRSQAKTDEETANLSSPGVANGLKNLRFPTFGPATKAKFAIKTRKNMLADATETEGVVADYIALPATEPDPMIFQGDTTYFVDGIADFDDVVFEGGSVIKYPNDTSAYIEVDGNLTCTTSPFLISIFTSADDDSVGQSMGGGIWTNYTGTIRSGGYANPALLLVNTTTLSNIRIDYAAVGVEWENFQGDFHPLVFNDCQVENCSSAVTVPSSSGGDISINVLFNNSLLVNNTNVVVDNTLPSGNEYYYFNYCTVDRCASVLVVSNEEQNAVISLYNSIFSDITYFESVLGSPGNIGPEQGGNNGYYNTPAVDQNAIVDDNYPYKSEGGGNYYLADNTFRGKGGADNTEGTYPGLLADLAQRTTWPPTIYDGNWGLSSLGALTPQVQRDTNSCPG